MTTLTKAELAEMLFEQVGLNKREAKDMVEAFFDEIRDALESGDGVTLSAISSCVTSRSARVATPRPERKFRSPRGVS